MTRRADILWTSSGPGTRRHREGCSAQERVRCVPLSGARKDRSRAGGAPGGCDDATRESLVSLMSPGRRDLSLSLRDARILLAGAVSAVTVGIEEIPAIGQNHPLGSIKSWLGRFLTAVGGVGWPCFFGRFDRYWLTWCSIPSWRRPSLTARSMVSRGIPSGRDALMVRVTVTVAPVATSGDTATLTTSRILSAGI